LFLAWSSNENKNGREGKREGRYLEVTPKESGVADLRAVREQIESPDISRNAYTITISARKRIPASAQRLSNGAGTRTGIHGVCAKDANAAALRELST
jgi:hypothetical protein